MGESAVFCRGRRPRRPAAHGSDLLPPSANPQTPNRERRPRRSAQQHKTEATRRANPHHPRCRARRPRRAAQQGPGFQHPSGEFAASHCRERACPFRAGHGPTQESPGECATHLRIRRTFMENLAAPAGASGRRPLQGGCVLPPAPSPAVSVPSLKNPPAAIEYSPLLCYTFL